MKGMKKRRTSEKTATDPNSRINKSLRKWNCSTELPALGSLSEKKVNPWAVCHASTGPKKSNKFERCVKQIKGKQGIEEMDIREKLIEAFQYKIEESSDINNFLRLCEKENINIDSLTEDQINELFGAFKRMGGAALKGLSGAKNIISKGVSKTADSMAGAAEKGWNKNVQAGHTGLTGLGRKVGGAVKGMAKEARKGMLSGSKKLGQGVVKTGGAIRRASTADPIMDRLRQRRADRARANIAAYNYTTQGKLPNFKGDTENIAGTNRLGQNISVNVPKSIAKEAQFRLKRGYSDFGESKSLFGQKIVESFSELIDYKLNELKINKNIDKAEVRRLKNNGVSKSARREFIGDDVKRKESDEEVKKSQGKNSRRSAMGGRRGPANNSYGRGEDPKETPMPTKEINKARGPVYRTSPEGVVPK
jgi:hypothetical protein